MLNFNGQNLEDLTGVRFNDQDVTEIKLNGVTVWVKSKPTPTGAHVFDISLDGYDGDVRYDAISLELRTGFPDPDKFTLFLEIMDDTGRVIVTNIARFKFTDYRTVETVTNDRAIVTPDGGFGFIPMTTPQFEISGMVHLDQPGSEIVIKAFGRLELSLTCIGLDQVQIKSQISEGDSEIATLVKYIGTGA